MKKTKHFSMPWRLLAALYFGLIIGSTVTSIGNKQPGFTIGWEHVVTAILAIVNAFLIGWKSAKEDKR